MRNKSFRKPQKPLTKKYLTFLFLLIITVDVSGYAAHAQSLDSLVFQISVPSLNNNQDPKAQELETQEKILAELKKLREQVVILEKQVDLSNKTLEVYTQIDEARKIQIAALKSAIEDTSKYNELNEKKESLFRQEISLLNTEIIRLDKELSKEKRSKLLSKIGSALLTVAAVYAASR